MANVDAAYGFLPLRHLNGSPFNAAINRYYCPSGRTSAHAVFPGDPVKLEANASSIGVPCVDLADATTDIPVGIVVSVEFLATNLNQLYIPVGIGA